MVGVGCWAEVVRHGQLPEKIELAITERQAQLFAAVSDGGWGVAEAGEGGAVGGGPGETCGHMVLFASEQWRKFDYCLPLMTNVGDVVYSV